MAKNTATVPVFLAICVGPWPFWILWHLLPFRPFSTENKKGTTLPFTLWQKGKGKGEVANDKVENVEGEHHGEQQKNGKRRIWPKTLQLSPYVWPFVLGHGHSGFHDMLFLSVFFPQKVKKGILLPFTAWQKGKVIKWKGQWPLTRLRI